MSNGKNNRIALPGAVSVETTYIAGQLATPANIVLQSEGQMKVLIMGGMTKLEATAGLIAGHLTVDGELTNEMAAELAVTMAEAVLAACQARQQPKQKVEE